MSDKQYKSLFDIIGPIMIGPSSSHTAGAVRIGNMARNVFKDIPDKVHIFLYGSFAETYKGHGTNLALLGGLLGLQADDDGIQEAMLLAKEMGVEFSFIPLAEKTDHPNTAQFVMYKGERKMSVTGISIGGGSAQLTHIDDYELIVQYGVNTLITYHEDVPGVIANISRALSDLDVNIASMKVWRTQRGEKASMVIEVDQLPKSFDIEILLQCPHINHVIFVEGETHELD